MLKVNSILARWISAYLTYGDPAVCLFGVFAPLKYFFDYCLVKQTTVCIINAWGYTEILLVLNLHS